MILFLQDYKKYPNAIIDINTTNRSFVRLSSVYREMGIKNHAFILALLNPKLQGIDPFSKNLTLEQMRWIALECKQNFWYFVREIARAPANVGLRADMVEANRGIIAMWWCFFLHVTYICTMPRQTGKSIGADWLMTGLTNFICNNTQINLLTKDNQLRVSNIKRLKEIYAELPEYLNFKTKEDSSNTETLTVKVFNNTYITNVPQASPKRAYNLGRGMSTPIVHIDEPPFQPNIDIALSSMLPGMGAVADKAEAQGDPYGILITTTAGKKDDPSGKYIFNFIQEAAPFTEKFFDAIDEEDLRKMITKNSRTGKYRVYGCFSHKQLGKTDEWLKRKLDMSSSTGDDANRDYFNVWTSGSATSPIATHILEKLNQNIQPPTFEQIQTYGSYILRWYIKEDEIKPVMATRKMCIGIDTSDGSGGDDISFVMTDDLTGELVAIGTFNETNLITFAQWLVWILETYENTIMIIERRSSAITIIDYLLMFLPPKNIDPFQRLFNWVVNDPQEYKELYKEACLPMRKRTDDIYTRAKKFFGFATSSGGQTNRSELYGSVLQNACKRCYDKIRDRGLTDQLSSLVTRNGRVDHDIDGHDDLVIGFLLCHWFLTMAKNLAFYGIDSKKILVEAQVKINYSPAEAYFVQEQQLIRERIQSIYEQLSNERDTFVCNRLEGDLRGLNSRIVLQEGEYCSIDAIIDEAKNARKSRLVNTDSFRGVNYYDINTPTSSITDSVPRYSRY